MCLPLTIYTHLLICIIQEIVRLARSSLVGMRSLVALLHDAQEAMSIQTAAFEEHFLAYIVVPRSPPPCVHKIRGKNRPSHTFLVGVTHAFLHFVSQELIQALEAQVPLYASPSGFGHVSPYGFGPVRVLSST